MPLIRDPAADVDETLRTRLAVEFAPTNTTKSTRVVAGDSGEFTAAETTLAVARGQVIVLVNDFGDWMEARCQFVPSAPTRPRRGMVRTAQLDPEDAGALRQFVREFVTELSARQPIRSGR